jgi:ribosomal-protein-alanine N-acetyltransferase
MVDPSDDVVTPRLILRLMRREGVDAALAGNVGRAEILLDARIPDDLLDHPSSLEFAKAQLDADPQYQPWSIRAIILPADRVMVGHLRFHSQPNPVYLRPFARDAVEFGYRVFPKYQRRGYGAEASGAAMGWAQAAFGVRRFIVSVSPNNTPSLALIARFGFARIGQQVDDVDGPEDIYLREVQPALHKS